MAEQVTTEVAQTLSTINEYLEYHPESGVFTWKKRSSARCRLGEEAGFVRKGYRCLSLLGVTYSVHRLVWLVEKGYWPIGIIDHRDQNKLNNKIDNLRDTNKSGNAFNKGLKSDNTSGHAGICWHKAASKWHVRISNKHIGLYESLDQAIEAREKALEQANIFIHKE